MSLPTRNLDDRSFQDIVDEAKQRIAASCPEWTDHNVSDPGVTLVELFAWTTEMILYRLNQVPEKNYIKLMELMGLKLREPEPARTELTFYLAAPQEQVVTIAEGTEVGTVRTETQPAIVFRTDERLEIHPPELVALVTRVVSSKGTGRYSSRDIRKLGRAGFDGFPAFSSKPRIRDALYFGFENDLSHHVLELGLTCPADDEKGPIGIRDNPPWAWEGFHSPEQNWVLADVETDETGGMNKSGVIRLRLPHLEQREIDGQLAYWVRCRVTKPKVEGEVYETTPHVSNVVASSRGGSVRATHASVVQGEVLGRSSGAPGQVFQVERTPLLRREPGETIEVKGPGQEDWEAWVEVEDFADSAADKKHFTCDSITGEVRFGPALPEPAPNGQSGSAVTAPARKPRSFGAIPPRGALIRFAAYRYGGGVEGNVKAHTLTQPKTSIPYVEPVTNHEDATGGQDAETIEMAQLRAPQLLRLRGRAVTAEDYEALAYQADSRVKRAHCVQTEEGGRIYLLLVPEVNDPIRPIAPQELEIRDDLRDAVQRYLDEYRLLTVKLDIEKMDRYYAWVTVDVTVVASANVDPQRVRQDAERALYRYFNPIVGGPSGDGWPFGRDLYPSDVERALRSVEGLEAIKALHLRVDPSSDQRTEETWPLNPPGHGLIASAKHEVKVDDRRI